MNECKIVAAAIWMTIIKDFRPFEGGFCWTTRVSRGSLRSCWSCCCSWSSCWCWCWSQLTWNRGYNDWETAWVYCDLKICWTWVNNCERKNNRYLTKYCRTIQNNKLHVFSYKNENCSLVFSIPECYSLSYIFMWTK